MVSICYKSEANFHFLVLANPSDHANLHFSIIWPHFLLLLGINVDIKVTRGRYRKGNWFEFRELIFILRSDDLKFTKFFEFLFS